MHRIFLETHNINNLHTGFGQFNLHLLNAIRELNPENLKFTIHAGLSDTLKKNFSPYFKHKLYFGARRYKATSVRGKYDVWHSLNQNTKVEPFGNIPYVLTVHDVNFMKEGKNGLNSERHDRFLKKIERANAITYISEYAKTSTHKYFDIPEDIPEYVVYNGNPATEFLDLSGFEPTEKTTKPFLFSVSNFMERKNFHLLVEMMHSLPEYNLVLAGNNSRDYGQKIIKLVETSGLQDRVLLPGRISETAKQYYLKNCSAFVFPSLNEGFGFPVIEAMKFGCPIMLSKSASLPEIGGKHAFYWSDYTPKNMASELTKSLETYNDNPDFYNEKYLERSNIFTWQNAAKQYVEIYRSVIDNTKNTL